MSVNESEALLAEQSRKTFLSLWSYQNPYYGPGKELCDVLIVIGDDVIIMSDKACIYGDGDDKLISWKRWYRKAVSSSVRQLRGALKQIRISPGGIFTDSRASSPFPLQFPPPERARYFLVAIAKGAEQACTDEIGTPGLILDTACENGEIPFQIGTFASEGGFVHVFSGSTVQAIFSCFDTATDFVDYLSRKEAALEKCRWVVVGEENLVGAYVMSQPGNRHYRIATEAFTKHQESIHGADWEWWFLNVKAKPKLVVRIQAKILDFKTGSYRQLHYKNGKQTDKLIAQCTAASIPLPPPPPAPKAKGVKKAKVKKPPSAASAVEASGVPHIPLYALYSEWDMSGTDPAVTMECDCAGTPTQTQAARPAPR